MIRVLIFLVAVAGLALGVVWLADRPGGVVVTWLGYHVETSITVAVAALATLLVCAVLAWIILRALVRAPRAMSRARRASAAPRGRHRALSRGLVAIGAGDAQAARRFAAEARRLAPAEPLALLLSAQSAQIAGDREAAERTFRDMTTREDTKLLGLHGLFVEAQRRDDPARRPRLCGGGGEDRSVARLGRPGGARVPLRRERLGRRPGGARRQHAQRPHRQGDLSAPARRAAHRAGAVARHRPRHRQDPGARSREAVPEPGAGGGARRPPACRGGRRPQGRAGDRGRLDRQPASRPRPGLCARLSGRFGARAARPHAHARPPQRPSRGRRRGGARRARRAGIRRGARKASRRCCRARPSGSPP